MIAAIDLGSTNFKGALFLPSGKRVASASRPVPYSTKSNLRSELWPEAISACFFGLLDELLDGAGISRQEISAVALASQATTFCVCDEWGEVKGPFLGWTDTRAEEEAAFLQRELGAEFHAEAGWPEVWPAHMLSKVLWWKNNNGLGEGDRIVSLPSFLAMQLGARHASDRNLAAMSGFYSIPRGGWWDRALSACGLAREQMGELVETGERLPTRDGFRPPGFSSSLGVVFAGNDHTAGAVGCGCREGRSAITLGTAGVFYRWAGNRPGPFGHGGLWGPYPGGGYYELLHIAHACSALDWADQALFGTVDSARFAWCARGADALSDFPLFNPAAWGTPSAWSCEGTREEKAYAVIEGIAFALSEISRESGGGVPGTYVALGGGSRLDFLLQLVADTFGAPVSRGETDALSGAALLAGLDPESVHRPPSVVFRPREREKALLSKRRQAWRAFTGTAAK